MVVGSAVRATRSAAAGKSSPPKSVRQAGSSSSAKRMLRPRPSALSASPALASLTARQAGARRAVPPSAAAARSATAASAAPAAKPSEGHTRRTRAARTGGAASSAEEVQSSVPAAAVAHGRRKRAAQVQNGPNLNRMLYIYLHTIDNVLVPAARVCLKAASSGKDPVRRRMPPAARTFSDDISGDEFDEEAVIGVPCLFMHMSVPHVSCRTALHVRSER